MQDILETMKAEIEEGMEVLRPHYPKRKDNALRALAEYWRPHYYKEGRWPTAEEIEAKKAKEIEAEKARVEAEKAKARKLETETV